MKLFAIYNKTTGNIEKTIKCQSDDLAKMQAKENEGVLKIESKYSFNVDINDDRFYVDISSFEIKEKEKNNKGSQKKDKDQLFYELRESRNKRLRNSDWTQIPDAPVDKAAWAEYRQKLRDLPQNTTDPTNVTWPEKPQ